MSATRRPTICFDNDLTVWRPWLGQRHGRVIPCSLLFGSRFSRLIRRAPASSSARIAGCIVSFFHLVFLHNHNPDTLVHATGLMSSIMARPFVVSGHVLLDHHRAADIPSGIHSWVFDQPRLGSRPLASALRLCSSARLFAALSL